MKCSIPFMQNWDFDTWDGADGGAEEAPFMDKENKEIDTDIIKRERVKIRKFLKGRNKRETLLKGKRINEHSADASES